MEQVKTAIFNGRKYKIDFDHGIEGFCEQYKDNGRTISISSKPYTRNELITILHECLHAENWTKGEKPVDQASKEIGNLLWRLGYRRKKVDDK